MSSSRTVSFFLHSPAPGIASPSLHTCTFRSLSGQHGIIRTRSQPRPRPHSRARFNPSSGPSFFSTTSARSHEQNYYEILDLPTTATPAEIKKYVHHRPPNPLYRNPAPIPNTPKENSTPSPSATTQTATAPTPTPPNASPASQQPTTRSATRPNAQPTTATTASTSNTTHHRPAATAATAQTSTKATPGPAPHPGSANAAAHSAAHRPVSTPKAGTAAQDAQKPGPGQPGPTSRTLHLEAVERAGNMTRKITRGLLSGIHWGISMRGDILGRRGLRIFGGGIGMRRLDRRV
jgi:hypothetical protein